MPRPDLDLTATTTLLCDADGNLFPSEDPAFAASTDVVNQLMEHLGVERRYEADELQRLALGRNFRGLAADLAAEHDAELEPADLDRWVAEEARVVTAHLAVTLRPDVAVTAEVERLGEHLRLAVVSSSALARLAACFTATGLDDAFAPEVRFSAQDSLPRPTSKPDPAVYLHALDHLGVTAAESLAVEDAVAGVSSAVAAGIATVGNVVFVPGHERAARRADLLDAGAVLVVEDWQELSDRLLGADRARDDRAVTP